LANRPAGPASPGEPTNARFTRCTLPSWATTSTGGAAEQHPPCSKHPGFWFRRLVARATSRRMLTGVRTDDGRDGARVNRRHLFVVHGGGRRRVARDIATVLTAAVLTAAVSRHSRATTRDGEWCERAHSLCTFSLFFHLGLVWTRASARVRSTRIRVRLVRLRRI
jgi:hypothetical protein